LRGRDFTATEAENKNSRRVAIIDEEMAKKLSRRVTRSDSGFATHKRRRTVRLTKWKLSGLSPHIDTKLSATKFRAGSLSRSGKLTTAASIFASA